MYQGRRRRCRKCTRTSSFRCHTSQCISRSRPTFCPPLCHDASDGARRWNQGACSSHSFISAIFGAYLPPSSAMQHVLSLTKSKTLTPSKRGTLQRENSGGSLEKVGGQKRWSRNAALRLQPECIRPFGAQAVNRLLNDRCCAEHVFWRHAFEVC